MNPDEERAQLGLSKTGRTIMPRLDDRPTLGQRTGKTGLASLRAQALIHERDRLETVAEFFCLMGVLAWAGILSGDNSASKGKTTYQDGKGSKKDNTEAAHCLPAQVLINGHLPNIILESAARVHNSGLKPLPVSSKLASLFARTNKTSVEVNDTDSSIEKVSGGLGIKIAFVKWTDHLLDILEKQPPRSKVDVLRRAQEAYQGFYEAEKLATRAQLNRRLSARILDANKRAKNEQQIHLLLSFMQAQAGAMTPPPLHASAFKMFWEEVARTET